MMSTPIVAVHHGIYGQATRLHDIWYQDHEIRCLVGSQAYPTLSIVTFENQERWKKHQNVDPSHVYPSIGDNIAFYDGKCASHLKCLSASFTSKSTCVLTFNDKSVYQASIGKDAHKALALSSTTGSTVPKSQTVPLPTASPLVSNTTGSLEPLPWMTPGDNTRAKYATRFHLMRSNIVSRPVVSIQRKETAPSQETSTRKKVKKGFF